MSHPHQYLLDEFRLAIERLPATLPKEELEKAKQRLSMLEANEAASEEEIKEALVETGRAEYPHRHALEEIAPMDSSRRDSLALEVLSPEVREQVGDSPSGFARDQVFGTADPELRREVEQALVSADGRMREELTKKASELVVSESYQASLGKWTQRLADIEEAIARLESLAERDPKWKEEIEGKVARYREGLLVTEQDPSLEEIRKEIENWEGVLGEGQA
jgi:hypothetical protein